MPFDATPSLSARQLDLLRGLDALDRWFDRPERWCQHSYFKADTGQTFYDWPRGMTIVATCLHGGIMYAEDQCDIAQYGLQDLFLIYLHDTEAWNDRQGRRFEDVKAAIAAVRGRVLRGELA